MHMTAQSPLTVLDVNSQLTKRYAALNPLKSIDLSNNPNVKELMVDHHVEIVGYPKGIGLVLYGPLHLDRYIL